MLKRDRKALQKCSAVLCKQMVVDELLIQSLQAEDILTESMAESIMAEQTSQKRSWRLLLLLPKRGPKAFSSFCSALSETEQQHLCDLLLQSPQTDSISSEDELEGKSMQQVRQTKQEKTEVTISIKWFQYRYYSELQQFYK